jgi:uncharacterized protein YbjT (DUF2867 family)
MRDDLILVAGATGKLGSVIVSRLLEHGYRVRALSRDAQKLETLVAAGAEGFQGDMLDRAAMDRACQGVTQVVSTANNILGKGAASPTRTDEAMYRTLGAAAREAGVRRWINISFNGVGPGVPVDFFRVKLLVDDVVRASGVPWVLVKPTAFMDVWAGVLFGDPDKPGNVATVFGRGDRVSNYIAIDDVATFILAIVRDHGVTSEEIDIGGPSDVSQVELATLIQRARGLPVKQRHVPAPVLGIARVIAKPFNEVAARFASMGYWTTLEDRRFPQWTEAATRFGVTPMTVNDFAERFRP